MTNDNHKLKSAISYSKIDAALKTPSHSETKRPITVQSEPIFHQESHGSELYGGSLSLFTPNPQPEQPEGYPDDYLRKKKKKKQRKIRWKCMEKIFLLYIFVSYLITTFVLYTNNMVYNGKSE